MFRRKANASLHSNRPHIGLLIDTGDAFGRALLRGVMRYANVQRRWILFMDQRQVLLAQSQWPKFDGIICAGGVLDVFPEAIRRCKNVVFCSGNRDASLAPSVSVDDLLVGQMAAEHLCNCQLTNFAYYGLYPELLVSANRFAGFKEFLGKKGYGCAVYEGERPDIRQRTLHLNHPKLIEWLRGLPKPVGIMAFDDTMANDLAAACLEADIGVPEHVAIIGVNNDDLMCESAWPPISSVNPDYARAGYAAAKLLEQMLAGETLSMSQRLVRLPPVGVAQRLSTEILAVNDQHLANAIRFIREHACDPCSVDDILQVVPITRRSLERQFVAQFGRTLHDEISRVRIDTACRMLAQNELKISEIARRCGYSGDNNFYALFKNRLNITPAEYRRQIVDKRQS